MPLRTYDDVPYAARSHMTHYASHDAPTYAQPRIYDGIAHITHISSPTLNTIIIQIDKTYIHAHVPYDECSHALTPHTTQCPHALQHTYDAMPTCTPVHIHKHTHAHVLYDAVPPSTHTTDNAVPPRKYAHIRRNRDEMCIYTRPRSIRSTAPTRP